MIAVMYIYSKIFRREYVVLCGSTEAPYLSRKNVINVSKDFGLDTRKILVAQMKEKSSLGLKRVVITLSINRG